MKLSRVLIKNFRCIEQLEIFPKAYTSLIGPNNSGKSATLRAVEILLNQETPASDEWRRGHESEPIVIEADFDDLEVWERDKPGISSLVYNNQIQLRMKIDGPNESAGRKKTEVIFESLRPEEIIDGWSDDDKLGSLDAAIQKLATENSINGTAFKSKANQERVRQLVREKMPERVTIGAMKWTSEGVSIPVALQQALPQVQIIPAVRDADADSQPGAKTSFGLLLKSVILPAVSGSSEYQNLMTAVTELEKKLRGDGTEQLPAVRELAEKISQTLSNLIPAKVTLGMDPPDADKFIGSSTVLRLDDGTPTRIALQGHGLQRALVFAMLEILASQKAVVKSAQGQSSLSRCKVLLFEEPELFIHPHLMRRLKESLVKISQRSDWQVIVTTHSPFLVDVAADPCSLVIHRRRDRLTPPTVKQLKKDPFVNDTNDADRDRLRGVLDFHPTVCEAFFAKHVVLVEGDSEIGVLVRQPDLYKLASIDLEIQKDTTVVSCDGKWTIIPVARLLKAFEVPLRVIHDMDRKGKSDVELATEPMHEFHVNKRIADLLGVGSVHVIEDTLEDILWESKDRPKSTKDKPYRAWKRIKELCENKSNIDHAPGLRDMARFAFSSF